MLDKGLIRIVDERRPRRYAANIDQKLTYRSMIRDLKAKIFGGSAASLVKHLFEANKPSAADMAEIKALIKEFDDKADKKK